jgi:hypothetical protein
MVVKLKLQGKRLAFPGFGGTLTFSEREVS